MEVRTFDIEGLLLFDLKVFRDDRGLFFESFNEQRYAAFVGEHLHFVQDNFSSSAKNVLRGLHFQEEPAAQGKLVQVLRGRVLDVAVDIRTGSPTFGQHQMVELSGDCFQQFWIPPGFAHGFISLEDDTLFSYKCTSYYSPEHERTIRWDDEDLNIQWGTDQPILSTKDAVGEKFITFRTI